MKKLVFGLAMLASLSTFAISPVKKSVVLKPKLFKLMFHVRCGDLDATFGASSYSEAGAIGNRICPGCNIIDIIR